MPYPGSPGSSAVVLRVVHPGVVGVDGAADWMGDVVGLDLVPIVPIAVEERPSRREPVVQERAFEFVVEPGRGEVGQVLRENDQQRRADGGLPAERGVSGLGGARPVARSRFRRRQIERAGGRQAEDRLARERCVWSGHAGPVSQAALRRRLALTRSRARVERLNHRPRRPLRQIELSRRWYGQREQQDGQERNRVNHSISARIFILHLLPGRPKRTRGPTVAAPAGGRARASRTRTPWPTRSPAGRAPRGRRPRSRCPGSPAR